ARDVAEQSTQRGFQNPVPQTRCLTRARSVRSVHTARHEERSVSVRIEDVEARDWTEKVHERDILRMPDTTLDMIRDDGGRALREFFTSGALAQSIDYERECRRGLPAAWVEEVVT